MLTATVKQFFFVFNMSYKYKRGNSRISIPKESDFLNFSRLRREIWTSKNELNPYCNFFADQSRAILLCFVFMLSVFRTFCRYLLFGFILYITKCGFRTVLTKIRSLRGAVVISLAW